MSLSFLKEILQKTVDEATAKGFDNQTYAYTLDSTQFFSESYLFGIFDISIDFKKSTNKAIKEAWTAIKTQSDWKKAIEAANEEWKKEEMVKRPVSSHHLNNNHSNSIIIIIRTSLKLLFVIMSLETHLNALQCTLSQSFIMSSLYFFKYLLYTLK